ncbi:hypothetical protein IFR04_012611 [Cadophora malorum]|uniref:FAD-binding PCMH-type domain-containing protein n=1 Tax=Cadophora malorum TaxID=108018 RepID=A0A8H7W7Z5_9HELO|nr:hypothetical protein IFR04_012611 [Cadophora malorum]
MPQILSLFSTCLLLVPAVLSNPASTLEGLVTRQKQNLQDCLASRGVPTALNSSSDWSALIAPYNLRLPYTPTAVTIPTNHQHVSDSVTCAAAAGVQVQARSGGHSFASYSLGGKDGTLVVDLQKFNNISLDKSTGIVTAGGGVRLGNLGVGVFSQGQRALPHGTFPGVGIGGHYTHGGFGYSSRRWGLALDAIIAMDVVLADGTYIHTTPTSSSEIYYALRGAADSFGIVTTFYLQTQPAPSQVVSFSANFASALESVDAATGILLQLQAFATTSPYMDRNTSIEVYMDVFGNYTIRGWYFGDLSSFTRNIFPAMLSGMPTPDNSVAQYRSWQDALHDIADGESLVQPLSGYDIHQTFYTKSTLTREAKPLTEAALRSFFTFVVNKGLSATNPWSTLINLYGGKDSQVNAPSPGSSAYPHRDSLWVIQNNGGTVNTLPPFSSEIKTFINELHDSITSAQPDGDFLAYLNYVDSELTPKDAARLYYGAATYNKLVQIKKAVDPKAVFWNPQAIGNVSL